MIIRTLALGRMDIRCLPGGIERKDGALIVKGTVSLNPVWHPLISPSRLRGTPTHRWEIRILLEPGDLRVFLRSLFNPYIVISIVRGLIFKKNLLIKEPW